MFCPSLTILHNHGALVLRNATIDANGVARGTVLSGGTSSRLGGAVTSSAFPVGEEVSWPTYGRPAYQVHAFGHSPSGNLERSATPGAYEVFCVFA